MNQRSNGLSLESLWKEVGFKPNPNQRDAILHFEGPLYLPAGPGSGKTRVLLWRTLNLIVFHNVPQEEIFLATFTEKAAFQLREGLRALLSIVTERTNKPYDLSKVYVGTLHSLCQRLILDRRFTPDRRRGNAPTLMDELGQYLFVYKKSKWNEITTAAGLDNGANTIINSIFRENGVSRHTAVTNCISLFNRLSEECLKPQDIRVSKKADDDMRLLANLYEAYCHALDNGRLSRTDFALLQQKALEVLKKYPAASQVFRYVIVDEYQDTNTIQERLYFQLASGHKNLCIVGDDDQALYRFRGSTVENFVEFPRRCIDNLGLEPCKIPLSTNYRSRRKIVTFYGQYITHPNNGWCKEGRLNEYYRVVDKDIRANSHDNGPSVIVSTRSQKEVVFDQIADLVKDIIETGKVENPNQIAFLYPSLKSSYAKGMIEALKGHGLKVYAPRAGTFLQVEEALDVFGLLLHVFAGPDHPDLINHHHSEYSQWLSLAYNQSQFLIDKDRNLSRFIDDRHQELETVAEDYRLLKQAIQHKRWDLRSDYRPEMGRILGSIMNISKKTQKALMSRYFEAAVLNRQKNSLKPFSLSYAINRAAALDWNVLDLFYRLCGFNHFKEMFDRAKSDEERDQDEGPICNLSLISQYLSRFMDEYSAILTGDFLSDDQFVRVFFHSYLYAIFRKGEGEYEYAEDPFPKGRIPFLTVHQAKGLEFPVVVLGNPYKQNRGLQTVERMVQPLLKRKGEPPEKMPKFDILRMFYVALSRPQNLLVIADYKGHSISPPLDELIVGLPAIPEFDITTLSPAALKENDLPKNYSYTGDYLNYRNCPRQYMIFRKYGFVPSRSQTMFFGSLIHDTLDDFHQYLISRRQGS